MILLFYLQPLIFISSIFLGCTSTSLEFSYEEKHDIYSEPPTTQEPSFEEPTQEDTAESITDEQDPYCPENMVSVRDELEEPVYCIDIYEITISEGELGNMDQGEDFPDGSTEALALSNPLESPELYFSWYQAVALCQNAGKYLCSSAEWVDGCDGVYGDGGTNFPYGNSWIEGYCAARLGEEAQAYDSVQPTGAHPECESHWGTFDQIGNAWEWTDPMQTDDNGIPITNKMGASYYSGGGNIQCESSPVANHPPEFGGVISARCCASPTYPE